MQVDYLIVGLGNPGKDYIGTRHNIGFEVVDKFAQREGIKLSLEKSLRSQYAKLNLMVGDDEKVVVLLKPLTFMNDSGLSVREATKRFGFGSRASSIIVVHDELDLPVGVVKIKLGGGMAGHNGLSSIRDQIHTSEFLRIRIGIGRPRGDSIRYVLGKPNISDRKILDSEIDRSLEIIDSLISDGVSKAMNDFN